MNQDIYQIIQSMQIYLNKQNQTIQTMQKKIKALEKQVTELQKRPPVHVEKMEYKFDQLKVETLEGTLNIGLNPSDLQGIEDFSVPNNKNTQVSNERMPIFSEIENSIEEYLDSNIELILNGICHELHFKPNESYRDFIVQDIKKQLPRRIEYYINQSQRNEVPTEQEKEWIFQQLIKEIYQGVRTFLQNLPENMKGKD